MEHVRHNKMCNTFGASHEYNPLGKSSVDESLLLESTFENQAVKYYLK
jgi:hypothetical protein